MSQTPSGQSASVWGWFVGFFGENPPWRSKSVVCAAAIMLLGLGFWLQDRKQVAADPARVSALFRGGASYLGGYFLGWAFRRGLKPLLLIGALIFGGVALMKATGWVDLNWDSIEQNLAHSFNWVRGEAEGWKKLLSGYLPSAVIAAVGLLLGAGEGDLDLVPVAVWRVRGVNLPA